MREIMVAAILLAGALSGCLTQPADLGGASASGDWPRCEHPWPCGEGSEWPPDLQGPFALDRIERVQVESHDGVTLDGWVLFPDVPEGVRLPTVLVSNPYVGWEAIESYRPDDPRFLEDGGWIAPVAPLIENGYAFALFSVRGTGNSGGCFSWLQPDEQADQPLLVEWIANQPWSNGRVGMYGLSYVSTTAFEAAAASPSGLKTIVVAGVIPELYLRASAPQGAIGFSEFDLQFPALVATEAVATDPEYGLVGQAPQAAERACPGLYDWPAEQTAMHAALDRDEAFWTERSVRAALPDVTAAVLHANGYYDGIRFLDDTLWQDVASAPKRAVIGPWGHEWPQANVFNPDPEYAHADWGGEVLEWYDFWLKGLGDGAPGVGTVEYMDSTGAWRTSTAWPPVEARSEVLYLAGDALQRDPGASADSRSFRASTYADANTPHDLSANVQELPVARPYGEGSALCAEDRPYATAVAYVAAAVASPTLLAGNPHAYLRLESDLEGGTFALDLFDLAPDFRCEDGAPHGASWIMGGAADLRFLHGNFAAEPFPTNTPTMVRVDFANVAHVLDEAHRLALVVRAGDIDGRTSPAEARRPLLTLHADAGAEASHLVLPIVEGTLGGAAPTLAYPPRPFSLEVRP